MRRFLFVIILVIIAVLIVMFYEPKTTSFSFREELLVQVTPEQLWNYLDKTFEDSTNVTYWPHTLENIYSINGLKHNEAFSVTYITLLRDKTYTYQITELEKYKSFSYESQAGHPFSGKGTLTFIPKRNGERTLLVWSAEYSYKGFSRDIFYLKSYFENEFFIQLRKDLKQVGIYYY